MRKSATNINDGGLGAVVNNRRSWTSAKMDENGGSGRIVRYPSTPFLSQRSKRKRSETNGFQVVDHATPVVSASKMEGSSCVMANGLANSTTDPGHCNNTEGCVTLADILTCFDAAVTQDQAWALIYQSVSFYKNRLHLQYHENGNNTDQLRGIRLMDGPENLRLHNDGSVHVSFGATDPAKFTLSEHKILYNVGAIVYRALDHNIPPDEECVLSASLESVIETMTANDVNADEGIGNDSVDGYDDTCIETKEFDRILGLCLPRVAPAAPNEHYKAVCRALVTEALELRVFLQTITSERSPILHKNADIVTPKHELLTLAFSDWARLWIQVVDELRQGVQLRKCNYERPSYAFELTPYEALMADIRLRRYQLRKVAVNGSIPLGIKSDAHAIILEFIRSRPPLKKASERILAAQRQQTPSLREQLLDSIRRGRVLKHIQPKMKAKVAASSSITADHKFFQNRMNSRVPMSMSIRPSKQRLIRVDPSIFDDDTLYNFHESGHGSNIGGISTARNGLSVNYQTPKSRFKMANGHIDRMTMSVNEIVHIRSVMGKVALENLPVSAQERELIDKRRLCSRCVKTRLSIFALFERGIQCKLCQRTVCSKCHSKVRISANQFQNVPIHLLALTTIDSENVPPSMISTLDVGSSSDTVVDFTTPSSCQAGTYQSGRQMDHPTRGDMKAVCIDCRQYVQEIARSSKPAIHLARKLDAEL